MNFYLHFIIITIIVLYTTAYIIHFSFRYVNIFIRQNLIFSVLQILLLPILEIMGKIMKPGRVAIVLNGRFAGRKAVVVKSYDEGSTDRPYGHALIAGINKYPLKVTKRMGKKKVAKRIRIKPFIKVVSLQHLLPTRCIFDADFDKSAVNKESIKEPRKKKNALSNVKKELETHYKTGKSKWLFTKLRF